jgi:hypothetical protein
LALGLRRASALAVVIWSSRAKALAFCHNPTSFFVTVTKQEITAAHEVVLTALFALPKTLVPLGIILTLARWTFAVAILVAAPLGTPLLALVDLTLVATLVVAVATGREITSGKIRGGGHWNGQGLGLGLSSHGSQVLARQTGSDESKG